MKNLKKIIIWFIICIVVTVGIKLGGFEVDPHKGQGTILGAKVTNPGFGPLLEKEKLAQEESQSE